MSDTEFQFKIGEVARFKGQSNSPSLTINHIDTRYEGHPMELIYWDVITSKFVRIDNVFSGSLEHIEKEQNRV